MDGRDELGRFVPGESGNPNGRPKFSIVSIIREKLETVPEGEKRTRAERMVEDYLQDVEERNDGVAIRDLIDRFDGKPKQTVNVQNDKDAEWLQLFRELKNESESESATAGDTEV